ncbi:PREDICTED: uncharacterized protein LOC109237724 [Nicotiana attenuata]|uniref:uncharacterized protein LOC109237724 n=1 Tax=Nicotiana attenuata TaxID=49451 RepID=UPI0009052A8C|nr:PREDICTED: uncharacterized protein LOC109237724 [Nicotiana attenuata]
MAQHNQAWQSEDRTSGIAYGSPSLTNLIKENQERDQVIVGLASNVNVLTKMFAESQTKKGQCSNKGSSSDSKLECMLERVLQNQEKSDTSMRNMTELVVSHTESIQKLDMQMRDLSREQNPKQKGTLPSDTIVNPRGSGSGPSYHIMAITTRSGKLLQGESEQVVEVEESEQGVEVEEPSVVEVEKIPEELQVQKENREEVKEKQLSVNIPFVEAFQEMPRFAKYLKDLITMKRTTKNEVVNVTHQVSSIIATSTVQKKEYPGAFTIPRTIGARYFARALCDNGANINLMPLAIYKEVGLEIPIILGRQFLATRRALMDSELNDIKFRVNDEEFTIQASNGMKLPHEYESIWVIDVVDKLGDAVEMKMEEKCLDEALAAILVNFDGEDMEGYMESVNALEGLGTYMYAPAKLSLDLENKVSPPAKPSIIEPPQLELKPLPPHLRYKFLGSNNALPVIVSSLLNDVKVE